MEGNWNAAGYTAPNPDVYPYLWLWDSCFHVLIWAQLAGNELAGNELAAVRARQELESIFQPQDETGFIPHINYFAKPNRRFSRWARRWGRLNSSAISQPPMYGHTIAELFRKTASGSVPVSFDEIVSKQIIEKAAAGLYFFLMHRKRNPKNSLLYLCHPWESGMDDSPRWDDYIGGTQNPKIWNQKKLQLLKTLELSSAGAPVFNPGFPVTSIGFNSLVAFNALELAEVTGDSRLKSEAEEIIQALQSQFSSEHQTWVDGDTSASQIRTLDSLFPGLLCSVPPSSLSEKTQLVLNQLLDPNGFSGEFGPPSVHRQESSFQPGAYWRGSVWPQMIYLFWVMARRHGLDDMAESLAAALKKGVEKSGFSEHWNADTGEGLGAKPQSWSGLVLLTS